MNAARLLFLPLVAAALPASAAPAQVARGLALAEANCARCHAIGATGDSADAMAPRFRDLAALEPGKSMDEIFAKAVLGSHMAMPNFGMTSADRADLLAYLVTVRQAPPASGHARR